MTLSKSLGGGTWALGIILIGLALVFVYTSTKEAAYADLARSHFTQALHARAVESAVLRVLRSAAEFTLDGSQENRAAIDRDRARVDEEFNRWSAHIDTASAARDEESRQLDRLNVQNLRTVYRRIDSQVLALVASDGSASASAPASRIGLFHELRALAERELSPLLAAELTLRVRAIASSQNAAARAQRHGIRTAIVCLVLAVLIAVLARIWLVRPIIARIGQLREAVARLHRGELQTQIEIKGDDELAELAATFSKMSQALKATTVSRDHVDQIMRSMLDTMIVVAADGRIDSANLAAHDLLGFAEGELTGKNIHGIVCTDSGEDYFTQERAEFLGLKGNTRDQRVFYVTRYGERVQMSLSGSVMAATGGGGRLFVLQARDMRRLEGLFDEIHDARRFNEGIVRTMPSALVVLDAEGKVLRTNPAFSRLFGRSGLHDTLADLMPQPAVQAALAQAQSGNVVSLDVTCDTADQQNARLNVTISSLAAERESEHTTRVSASGLAARMNSLVVITDETERHRLLADLEAKIAQLEHTQAQLMQSEKMAAIGTLAGGISHDFKNLLTVILGYNELLQKRLDQSPSPTDLSLTRGAEQISRAGKRASQLVRQLLTFSRKQRSEPKEIVFETMVTEMMGMLRPLIGEHIELEAELDAEGAAVLADAGQLQQVILNLVVNARDAMADGGRITIRTQSLVLERETMVNNRLLPAGAHVVLSISDTGCGIPAEDLERVFEPFYTTKPRDQGTGLGLSTALQLVGQNHGIISIESRVGRGTTIKIYLPTIKASPLLPAADTSRLELPRGTETILLAEDEPAVLGFARDLLAGMGYHVLVACDGEAALEIARAYSGEIKLLLSDVVMPKLGGMELAARLAASGRCLRVLLVSGYSEKPIERPEGILESCFCFLPKPFTAKALVHTVRRLLDQRVDAEISSQ